MQPGKYPLNYRKKVTKPYKALQVLLVSMQRHNHEGPRYAAYMLHLVCFLCGRRLSNFVFLRVGTVEGLVEFW